MTSEEFIAIRLQLGLTQAQLGKELWMTQAAVSRLESGKRQPTKMHARAITLLQEVMELRGKLAGGDH